MNLAQWFAGLLLGISASLVAKSVAAGRNLQIAVFFLVLASPFTVLQASTTQNDLIAAFFLMTTAAMWAPLWSQPCAKGWIWGLAAASLAIATKATTLMIIPFLCLIPMKSMFKHKHRFALLLISLLMFTPSLGWTARNISFFGNPLGYQDDWCASQNLNYYRNTYFSTKQIIGSSAKHISLLVATPIPRVNQTIESSVRQLHQALGIDPDDEGLRWYDTWYHVPLAFPNEDNPPAIHYAAVFVYAVLASLLSAARRCRFDKAAVFGLIVCTGFIATSSYVKWMPWNSRFLYIWLLIGISLLARSLDSLPQSIRIVGATCCFIIALAMVLIAPKRALLPLSIPYGSGDFNLTSVWEESSTQITAPQSSLAGSLDRLVALIKEKNPSAIGIARGGPDSPVFQPMMLLKEETPSCKFYLVGFTNRSSTLSDTPICNLVINVGSATHPAKVAHLYTLIDANDYGSLWKKAQ